MDTERRIADLKAKLASRNGKPGYTRNVEKIQAELAKLQKAQAQAAVNRTANPTDSVETETGLTGEDDGA